jgi:hypothetical protein
MTLRYVQETAFEENDRASGKKIELMEETVYVVENKYQL